MTFAEAVREILLDACAAPERPTPGNLAERISRQAEKYLDRVRFDPAQYVRHPVLIWDDWEVMIIGWEAGQVTPVHDHRGVLGGMAMLSGSLLEERFTTSGLAPKLVDSRVRPEGDLCDIGPTTLHRLVAPGGPGGGADTTCDSGSDAQPAKNPITNIESGSIDVAPSRFQPLVQNHSGSGCVAF